MGGAASICGRVKTKVSTNAYVTAYLHSQTKPDDNGRDVALSVFVVSYGFTKTLNKGSEEAKLFMVFMKLKTKVFENALVRDEAYIVLRCTKYL